MTNHKIRFENSKKKKQKQDKLQKKLNEWLHYKTYQTWRKCQVTIGKFKNISNCKHNGTTIWMCKSSSFCTKILGKSTVSSVKHFINWSVTSSALASNAPAYSKSKYLRSSSWSGNHFRRIITFFLQPAKENVKVEHNHFGIIKSMHPYFSSSQRRDKTRLCIQSSWVTTGVNPWTPFGRQVILNQQAGRTWADRTASRNQGQFNLSVWNNYSTPNAKKAAWISHQETQRKGRVTTIKSQVI